MIFTIADLCHFASGSRLPESLITNTSNSLPGTLWLSTLSTARCRDERPMVGMMVEHNIQAALVIG
jgi:hypothetical protein